MDMTPTDFAQQVKGIIDSKLNAIDTRLSEVEQKGARPAGAAFEAKSWGAQFAQSPGFAEFKTFADQRSRPGRFGMELKTTITTAAQNGYALAPDSIDPSLVLLARRIPRVRDLIPAQTISTGAVDVVKQTARPTAAATVAEGALKPESAMTFDLVQYPARVIAHWIPASVQILDDAPQLQSLIDTEMRSGLALAEDVQLLLGDGTGANLYGIIPQATAYAAPYTLPGTPTKIDRIGSALLQVTLANFAPTAIVMHPSDWLRITLSKDAASGYLFGQPGAVVAPNLFGVPVVPTTAMTIGKFLIGDFVNAATIYDRWLPRVEVSTEHADFFVRNLVAVRCESRLAFAVKQAAALVYGDFSADA